jgi:hypothetical protein
MVLHVSSLSLLSSYCRFYIRLILLSKPRNFLLENIVARYKEECAKAGKKMRNKPVMCQVRKCQGRIGQVRRGQVRRGQVRRV